MTENEILDRIKKNLSENKKLKMTLHEVQNILDLGNIEFISSVKNLMKKRLLKMHPINDNWDQLYPEKGDIISISLNA